VKLTKLKGRFVWHFHRDEDEIKDSEIYVRGRKAMELVPPSTLRLLKACNTTVEILDKVAKDRNIQKNGFKP
jgi:hypothetical protein